MLLASYGRPLPDPPPVSKDDYDAGASQASSNPPRQAASGYLSDSANVSLVYELMLNLQSDLPSSIKTCAHQHAYIKYSALRLSLFYGQLASRSYLCTPLAARGFIPRARVPRTSGSATPSFELCCCGCPLRFVRSSALSNATVAASDSVEAKAEAGNQARGEYRDDVTFDAMMITQLIKLEVEELSHCYTQQQTINDCSSCAVGSIPGIASAYASTWILVESRFAAKHSTECEFRKSFLEIPHTAQSKLTDACMYILLLMYTCILILLRCTHSTFLCVFIYL